jgi:hypothetical protein
MATVLRNSSAKILRVLEFSLHRARRPSDVPTRMEARTCIHCGAHVPFRTDPLGGWAECTACDRLN